MAFFHDGVSLAYYFDSSYLVVSVISLIPSSPPSSQFKLCSRANLRFKFSKGYALVGITGPNEHLQHDKISPQTLSFHFPSEFREKGLQRSLSESPCRGHYINLQKYFCSRHAVACLCLGSTSILNQIKSAHARRMGNLIF